MKIIQKILRLTKIEKGSHDSKKNAHLNIKKHVLYFNSYNMKRSHVAQLHARILLRVL